MALRCILSFNRLMSYPSMKWSQPLLEMRNTVFKCNSSMSQVDVWMKYSTFQYNRNGCCQLAISKTPITHEFVRYYAKSRDKKKSDKGHKKKVHISEELLAEVINVNAMQEQMLSAIEKLKHDFVKNLSLRSTSGSIEVLPITFEGKDYILQDLAQVVRKNPKTVVINMAAFPQAIPTVVQAIGNSGMNLNPQQDESRKTTENHCQRMLNHYL
uniref:Ribosome-recycling factor, mitochondrial n=1 Tax=Graphocephala atropunctata TaxID=36148 RepID=A0A1B6KA20_9HEMI